MMHRLCHWLACASVLWMSAGAASAQEGYPSRVGRLVEVQGVVWLYDRDERSWTQALTNRPITSGDQLSTEPNARAELRIGSTTVRLAGETEFEVRRLDDAAIELQLSAGSLALRVTSPEVVSQIVVVTPEGRFLVRTTGSYRIDRHDDSSQGSSWRGSLEFQGRDSNLGIGRDQHAEFWLQGPTQATHFRWLPIERDGFADWVARDDRDADLNASTGRYVSPEMTGWEDLDRNGRWQLHPEYGNVWTPTVVVSGWEPFQQGRWVWQTAWGWTWVDAAPWGFAPFHYGRWVRWGGRWCWAPGQRVPHPAFAPAVVSWAPAQPVRPGYRPPPPARWAPLPPGEAWRPHWRPQPVTRGEVEARDRDRGRDQPHEVPPPPYRQRDPRWNANGGQTQPVHGQRQPAPPATQPAEPVMYGNQGVPANVKPLPRNTFAQPAAPAPQPVMPAARPPAAVPSPQPAPPVARVEPPPRAQPLPQAPQQPQPPPPLAPPTARVEPPHPVHGVNPRPVPPQPVVVAPQAVVAPQPVAVRQAPLAGVAPSPPPPRVEQPKPPEAEGRKRTPEQQQNNRERQVVN